MSRKAITMLALALAWPMTACERLAAPPAFDRPPTPVIVAKAVSADVPLYLDEIGRCVAREMVTLQPQVSGRITQIHFDDGAEVRAGDPLFTIDPRPFQAQLAASEASLAQGKAERDLAKLELARATTLLEKKAIAQQEVDTSRNAVDVAEARVRQYQAAVETARLNLEYCSLRSPIDGRTGHRLVDAGNTVTANTTALLVIQRMDPVYADFAVTEAALSAVQRHMGRKAPQAQVRIPDEPGEPRLGELTFLDNAVQESTGTVMLRATVPNPDRRLWPGRYVKIRLILDVLEAAVLVPAEAPQMSAKGPFVYVVKDDLTAELRPVRLGQRQEERVIIQEGLQSGERVITVGHIGVMPGGKVRIDEPRPAGAGPAPQEPGN